MYFPVFLLGAVFGKLIELSGFLVRLSLLQSTFSAGGMRFRDCAGMCITHLWRSVAVCGGIAVYPFAAELFRQSNIPKRLYRQRWPWGHSLLLWTLCPARTNSEHYSYQFLWHQRLGRAGLGLIGSLFIIAVGLIYLERSVVKRRQKMKVTAQSYLMNLNTR